MKNEHNADYEWGVMHARYPEEPHRGPMSEAEAREWVRLADYDGFKSGVFYVVRRTIGPWTRIDGRDHV
jgi:hypothetical protein